MNIDEVKVYQMNDYSWFASRLDKEKTNDCYEKHYGKNDIEQVVECDIDNDGMWFLTTDENDIKKIKDEGEIYEKTERCKFGDLKYMDGEVYKFISFRKAIELIGDFTEPYEIASKEW